MSVRIRGTVAALLATGALIAGVVALDGGPASAAPASCDTPDRIQAISMDSGQPLGYLQSTGAYTVLTRSQSAATVYSYAEGTRRNVVQTNGRSEVPNLGFVAGGQGTTLKAGSPGYALAADTATTAPGATPQSAPNTAFFGNGDNTESAVWSYDASSGVLTPGWINPDGQPAEVTAFDDGSGQYIGLTGDLAAFVGVYHDQTEPITFRAACKTTEPQAITFTSDVPQHAHVGDDYEVTATGGGSPNPVVFDTRTPDVCTVDGSTVRFDALGTCTIVADQAGDDNYDQAPQADQEVAVKIATEVALDAPDDLVAGQPTEFSARVGTEDGSRPEGTLQFAVDGKPVGDPVEIDGDGTATSPEYAGHAGDHTVTASFVAYDRTYDESQSSDTLAVAQADTTTAVSVDGSTLRAEVTPTAPGSGTPTGTVTFRVDGEIAGTADLTPEGTAKLEHPLPEGSDHQVSAEYAGDDDFVASSDSTSRTDPSIVATISGTRSKDGWYRSAVTVDFACTAHGSALVTDCPAQVVVSSEGAAQTVSRTVSAADGGIATATARFDIDRTAPVVRVSGVRARQRYFATDPRIGCARSDRLSGIRSCTITRSSASYGPVTVTARAIDHAGNLTVARAYYVKTRYAVAGATWSHGAWEVRAGHTYDLLAASGNHPRYVGAGTDHPSGSGAYFARSGSVGRTVRWSHPVTMDMSTRSTREWRLGIYDHRYTRVVPVRLVG